MFKFLKNKIKEAVNKFSKSAKEVEEEVVEDIPQEIPEQQPEQPVEEPTEDVPSDEPEDDSNEAEFEEEPNESIDEDTDEEADDAPEQIDEPVGEESPEQIVDDTVEEAPESVDEPEVIEMTEPQKVKVEEPKAEVPEELGELVEDETEAPLEEEIQEAEKLDELFVDEEAAAEIKEDVEAKEVEAEQPESPIAEPELTPEELEEEFDTEYASESTVEKPETPQLQEPKKKGFFGRLFGKKEEKLPEPEVTPEELATDIVDEVSDEPIEQSVEPEKHETDFLTDEVQDATKKKKGFFEKIKERVVKFQLTEEKFEEIFWDFELALMENNVALEVIEKVKKDMHDQLTKENVTRKSVDQVILDTLKESLEEVLTVEQFNFLEKVQTKKPYVITMVGVNGSGKTTTLAKIISLLQKNDLSVVVAASDTFRAAAIQQLEEHTTKLGVKLIKHDYNADPSAVAYDAISHAKAKDIDVVLIDTAGRLQSNSNLMDELKKLIRVNKPDLNIFIGESVTGNDCVEQAVAFNEAVGIDGIVLSKADIDEKGGAAISVSYVTKKPILYIGTGQTYDDLKPFNKEEVLANLGL